MKKNLGVRVAVFVIAVAVIGIVALGLFATPEVKAQVLSTAAQWMYSCDAPADSVYFNMPESIMADVVDPITNEKTNTLFLRKAIALKLDAQPFAAEIDDPGAFCKSYDPNFIRVGGFIVEYEGTRYYIVKALRSAPFVKATPTETTEVSPEEAPQSPYPAP